MFVRGDLSEDLIDCTARAIRGEYLDPLRCLYSSNDVSTLAHLAAYVRFCMTDPQHFSNESQVVMVLGWVHELCRFLSPYERDSLIRASGPLLNGIRKIRSVQVRRSGRYRRVVDSLIHGPVRDSIESWWVESLSSNNTDTYN